MQTSQNGGAPGRTTYVLHNGQYETIGVPVPHPMPNPDMSSTHQSILPALTLALTNLHGNSTERLDKLEGAIKGISSSISSVRDSTREDTLKLAEWLERSHVHQMKATQRLFERVEALEGTVGKVPSVHRDETLTGRLQRIDCVLHELLESTSDPDAARLAVPKRDVGINTSPRLVARDLVDEGVDPVALAQRVDTGVDARVLDCVDVGIEACEAAPVLVDASMSTHTLTMTDVGVDVRAYRHVDAAVDAVIVDEALVRRAISASPLDLPPFGAVVQLQPRFPTSPYNPDPLTPAKWSPPHDGNSGSGSPSSQQSYLPVEEYLARSNSEASTTARQEGETENSIVEFSQIRADASPEVNATSNELQKPTHHDDEIVNDPIVARFPTSFALSNVKFGTSSNIPLAHSTSLSTGSGAQTSSSPTAVNPSSSVSSGGSPYPVTQPSPASSTSSGPVRLPLPRRFPATRNQPRSKSASSMSMLSPPQSPKISRRETPPPPPAATSPLLQISSLSSMSSLSSSSSDSPPPPPPPPLPRRARAPQATAPQAQIRPRRMHVGGRARSRGMGVAHESSPEIQIIEKPVDSRGSGESKEKEKGKGKGRATKAQKRVDDVDQNRSRKRRKTDGDALEVPARPKRQRKTIDGNMMPKSMVEAANTFNGRAPEDNVVCDWPDKIGGDAAYQREFVQCDNCDAWYHFGCIGLQAGDSRLDEDAEFFCPPCEVAQEQRERAHAKSTSTAICARPDCDHPVNASDTDEYFVDRIVGRKAQTGDNEWNSDPEFLWLVKWDGYDVVHATWVHPMQLGDCSRYVSEFEVAAELEGRDLSDPSQTVVLNEAAVYGWC